jgi:hypothetical protein
MLLLVMAGVAGEDATHHHKKYRNQKNRQHGGGEHAADHTGADGMAAVGAGAGRNGQAAGRRT